MSDITTADEWTLNDLIKVSCDIGLIRTKTNSSRSLRDFRNFVHPRVELTTGVRISEAGATA